MALVSKYDTHKYNSDSIIAFCLAHSISYSWSLYEITPVVEKVLLISELVSWAEAAQEEDGGLDKLQ